MRKYQVYFRNLRRMVPNVNAPWYEWYGGWIWTSALDGHMYRSGLDGHGLFQLYRDGAWILMTKKFYLPPGRKDAIYLLHLQLRILDRSAYFVHVTYGRHPIYKRLYKELMGKLNPCQYARDCD